jgi:hypothetical protein
MAVIHCRGYLMLRGLLYIVGYDLVLALCLAGNQFGKADSTVVGPKLHLTVGIIFAISLICGVIPAVLHLVCMHFVVGQKDRALWKCTLLSIVFGVLIWFTCTGLLASALGPQVSDQFSYQVGFAPSFFIASCVGGITWYWWSRAGRAAIDHRRFTSGPSESDESIWPPPPTS